MEKLRDIFIIIGVCMIGGFIFNYIYQNEKQSKIEKDACIIVLYNEDYIKEKSAYTEKLLNVSNNIIVFDLLKDIEEDSWKQRK